MRNHILLLTAVSVLALLFVSAASAQTAPPRVVAWNDLGMHCMDPDFSIFSILPPYNTVNAHLVVNGKLVKTGVGYTLTYEGVKDANGSINTTSIGKTDFWTWAQALYGVKPAPDTGLAGFAMPGAANTPQAMKLDAKWNWFHGEGIPITPIDDAKKKNPYPLMKITARGGLNQVLASTVTTLPVSQEMSCNRCHASGASPDARPFSGWTFDKNPVKDDRWNILRLHDDHWLGAPIFDAALAKAGYHKSGLEATVRLAGKPVLCASCHASNALPGTGQSGISDLTHAIHRRHARVVIEDGRELDAIQTRTSCYTCHPGNDTRCLRGAMGKAIGSDGNFSMDCQDCHGGMSDVAKTGRAGWFDQPTCQNCHTGSATVNSGQIRYTSVFDQPGQRRQAKSALFATTPNAPAPGVSLYRFSSGHGGLQCSACHGPPHAIYPTSEANDNAQNTAIQGHRGTLTDCRACHGKIEDRDLLKGPHGMHPIDNIWAAGKHGDAAEKFGTATCQVCHGKDYRGTELSMAQGDRSYTTEFGARRYWRGFQVSCYDCHNGPTSERKTTNTPPVVKDALRTTPNDVALVVALTGTDANQDPLTYRIVSQPKHGKVGWTATQATYHPEPGYVGPDTFTFAAWDGQTNSNLATVTVNVTAATCPGSAMQYGFATAGTAGHLPQLGLTGCATPGKTVTLQIRGALGGSAAYLVIGATRGALELAPGLVLRVLPALELSPPLPLSGRGAGKGTFDLVVPIPKSMPTNTRVTLQAFVLDGAGPLGLSASNGLDVVIR